MIAAEIVVKVTRAELDTIERRTAFLSVEVVERLAARYAADTAAVMAAHSLVAIFLMNLPAYLDHERQGAPVGTPAIERPLARQSEYSAIVASNRRQDRGAPALFERVEAPAPVVERVEAPDQDKCKAQLTIERIKGHAAREPKPLLPLVELLADEAKRVMGSHFVPDDFARITHNTLTDAELIVTVDCEILAILMQKHRAVLYSAILERITGAPIQFTARYACAA